MLDSFYDACVDEINDSNIDWYRFLCDECFPDIWWENVTRNNIIKYIKEEADIEIKGSYVLDAYALIILHGGHRNLSIEVELTPEELADYNESMKCH